FTDLTAEQLAQKARSSIAADRHELLPVYGLFASEYGYQPVDIGQIPYGHFSLQFSQANANRLLHNYGALQSPHQLLALLRPDGFILINDYGSTETTPAEEYEHQRFSNATSIGLNFPLLKAFCLDSMKCEWLEPQGDNGHIHSRLVAREPAAETAASF